MRKIIPVLMICFLFLGYFNLSAQSVNPEKSTIEHNKNIRPCIVVNLDPGNRKLKKAWVKFLKKEYDLKLKGAGAFSNKDLLSAEKVVVDKLSSKQMDFYSYIVEGENGTEMKVFASFGYDVYINEVDYPDEFLLMNTMLTTFLKNYLPQYYNNEINASIKRVKVLNREINSLTKDIERNNLNIQKHKDKVEKLTLDVNDNSEKLLSAESKLKEKEEKLNTIKAELEKL